MNHQEHLSTLKQHIFIHDGIELKDLMYIHPQLFIILAAVNIFCYENNLRCEITSAVRTKELDAKLGAVSVTHQEGRAIDISIKDFPKEKLSKLESLINSRFAHIGALSGKTLESKPIVIHDNGNGPHIHLQVRKLYQA